MGSRYRLLAVYCWTVAAIAGVVLSYTLDDAISAPPLWIAALLVGACLFVFQFGVRAPRVGLISMERVPQIGMLLILPPSHAAAICALASLLWPLLNRRYSHGSQTVALLRGVHNAGMTVLMIVLAALAYERAGGRWPLVGLESADLWPLGAMAVVAQIVNISLMALFFKFDGREVKQIVTPSYALSDFIFVPAGILAAILFNAGNAPVFALFVVLTVVFVLSFNGLGMSFGNAKLERGPLARLFQTRRALHGVRHIDELSDRVVREARALVRFDEFHLILLDTQHARLDVRMHERDGERQPARVEPLRDDLFGWSLARCRSVLIADWQRETQALSERPDFAAGQTGSLLIVPLVEQGRAIGLMAVRHGKANAYSEADMHLFERLAEEVAAAVANARAFEDAEEYRLRLEQRVAERTAELEKANSEKERLIAALRERSLALERESQEDPLTGVSNRRHFMQRLLAEFEVSSAVGQPLTLAIADLDHFKVVNDRLGHRIGDDVLRQCAVLMRSLCGASDVVARIGGEEFAFLLPGKNCDAAIRLCENVRHTVESFNWRGVHPDLKVTVSIGLWQWDGKANTSELLHAADTQLYEAKRGGRNRVA